MSTSSRQPKPKARPARTLNPPANTSTVTPPSSLPAKSLQASLQTSLPSPFKPLSSTPRPRSAHQRINQEAALTTSSFKHVSPPPRPLSARQQSRSEEVNPEDTSSTDAEIPLLREKTFLDNNDDICWAVVATVTHNWYAHLSNQPTSQTVAEIKQRCGVAADLLPFKSTLQVFQRLGLYGHNLFDPTWYTHPKAGLPLFVETVSAELRKNRPVVLCTILKNGRGMRHAALIVGIQQAWKSPSKKLRDSYVITLRDSLTEVNEKPEGICRHEVLTAGTVYTGEFSWGPQHCLFLDRTNKYAGDRIYAAFATQPPSQGEEMKPTESIQKCNKKIERRRQISIVK